MACRRISRSATTRPSPTARTAKRVCNHGNTASAAEVTAAALRDYDRALLVGTTTYGKGVVHWSPVV